MFGKLKSKQNLIDLPLSRNGISSWHLVVSGLDTISETLKNGDFICLHSFSKLDQLPLGIIALASLAKVGSDADRGGGGGSKTRGPLTTTWLSFLTGCFTFWWLKLTDNDEVSRLQDSLR